MDSETSSALAKWMDLEGLGSGSIHCVRELTGGTQNILIQFMRGQDEYVLRRPPSKTIFNANETMRREARMLKALAGTGVPHPRFFAICETTDVLGSVFYLMESVDGFNVGEGMPALHASDPEIRRQMGFELIDALALLGQLDYSALGLNGFGKPDNYLQRQVPRWRSQLASYVEFANWPGPESLGPIARVAKWLEENCPASFKPGIIHGDYHLRNVLFSHAGPELRAIVDWELTTVGDPLVDLGGLLATWRPPGKSTSTGITAIEPWDGFPTSTELAERYAQQSGSSLDHIDWYVALASYKLAIILEGSHARACAGQASREVGDALHLQAVSLLERAAEIAC